VSALGNKNLKLGLFTTTSVTCNAKSGDSVKLHPLVTQLSDVLDNHSGVYPCVFGARISIGATSYNYGRRPAGIQDGGHNSCLVRKRLYFWLYDFDFEPISNCNLGQA